MPDADVPDHILLLLASAAQALERRSWTYTEARSALIPVLDNLLGRVYSAGHPLLDDVVDDEIELCAPSGCECCVCDAVADFWIWYRQHEREAAAIRRANGLDPSPTVPSLGWPAPSRQ